METVHLDRHGRILSTDGRVLGVLKPSPKKEAGIRCGACHDLIPYDDWNLHRYVCRALGRAGLKGDCRNFTPPPGRPRKGMTSDEFARRVSALMKQERR